MQRLTIQLLTAWVMAAVANFGHATPVVICTEAVDGCRAAIPTSAPELFVYSDGESQADPYGFVDLATGQRVHVSDAIELSVDWLPDPLAIDAFGSDGWQRLSDSYTWVLPETADFEPVAKWIFAPGGGWNVGTPDLLHILEPDGSLSDVIIVDNTGPNGAAAITFISGVQQVSVPEPGALLLLAGGLLPLLLRGRGARTVA